MSLGMSVGQTRHHNQYCKSQIPGFLVSDFFITEAEEVEEEEHDAVLDAIEQECTLQVPFQIPAKYDTLWFSNKVLSSHLLHKRPSSLPVFLQMRRLLI